MMIYDDVLSTAGTRLAARHPVYEWVVSWSP